MIITLTSSVRPTNIFLCIEIEDSVDKSNVNFFNLVTPSIREATSLPNFCSILTESSNL